MRVTFQGNVSFCHCHKKFAAQTEMQAPFPQTTDTHPDLVAFEEKKRKWEDAQNHEREILEAEKRALEEEKALMANHVNWRFAFLMLDRV